MGLPAPAGADLRAGLAWVGTPARGAAGPAWTRTGPPWARGLAWTRAGLPWAKGLACAACLLALAAALPAAGGAQGRTHAVIVVGLGGTEEFREEFDDQASRLYTALVERHGIPAEDVVYLSETVDAAPDMIRDRSTRANVLQTLGEIAQRAEPMDRLLVVLFGHGTADGGEARLNLPGPDLTPADFETGLTALPTQSLALVHTGSASGGFVAPLSGPNRIVITATRNERERNATEFGEFFVEAVAGEGADMDHDTRVSLLEAFLYARQEVERHYRTENEMLTEHAMLDDNGDGQGSEEAGLEGPDGPLAATFQLGGRSGTAAQTPDDPALAALYAERNQIQSRIDQLRAVRESMAEEAYLAEMEELLVELALKNREIRALEGGGGP